MGKYEVDIEEIEYLNHNGKPLIARVFKPRGKGPFPAVIDAHGGAWCEGTRMNNETINRPVAEGGVVVAALDFRNPPDATYPGSVADINYGVRWLKSQAARFNSRADMVGSMGTSSGGHLVVLAAMKPNDPRYAAIPMPSAPNIDARVPFVVTLWPVICPIGRYRTHVKFPVSDPAYKNVGGPAVRQVSYWLTEAAMIEGSANLILQRGEKVDLPNILYTQNPEDALHPGQYMEEFVSGYRKAGGKLQLELFEGQPYDLVRSKPETETAKQVIAKIIAYIHQQTEKQAKAA